MNTDLQFRALVVDDEPIVRQGTMRALTRSGFTCEAAANGSIALEMVQQSRYDLVVTDLRMSEGNGHQLAVELLSMPSRPAIVVLTGVMEPKLANDLRARGVDEILFKPLEYDLLATKARTIVDRRSIVTPAVTDAPDENISPIELPLSDKNCPSAAALHPLTPQLSKATSALRSPPNDFDGFSKASSKAFSTHDLTNAIQADPSVATSILSFANRALYSAHFALMELQRPSIAVQQSAVVRAIVIFIAGALVGWLLSWLGTGAGIPR